MNNNDIFLTPNPVAELERVVYDKFGERNIASAIHALPKQQGKTLKPDAWLISALTGYRNDPTAVSLLALEKVLVAISTMLKKATNEEWFPLMSEHYKARLIKEEGFSDAEASTMSLYLDEAITNCLIREFKI